MKKIVHIIACDKFTNGYINFMNQNINYAENYYIYLKNDKFKIDDNFNIISLNDEKDLFIKENRKLLDNAEIIVISGVFWIQKHVLKFSKEIFKKMYLHFWGGDFYGYRGIKLISKRQVDKQKMKLLIKRSAGIINLIEGDYKELCKIFPNNKKHFVAPVPRDPKEKIDYSEYISKNRDSINIVVGNSATEENCQLEIFNMLEHLKNEDIHIYCPLSYGDADYGKLVIHEGKRIFGEKFTGITEFMKYEEYIKFLSKCSIGIYNNNRQQAMGNINTLLQMGKKIYIRDNTSMYNDYIKNDIIIYPIKDLDMIKYKDLFYFDIKYAYQNNANMQKRKEKLDKSWKILLNELI